MMNLKLVGHACLQVFDGNEAVSAVGKAHPDLVILDVMLPYADGFSLMEQKIFENIPVIFLTAKGSTDDKVRGLKLGADDYFAIFVKI